MAKVVSLTEKQRQVLFATIANWEIQNSDYVYGDEYHGSDYNPEAEDEREERIAEYEAQCEELSAILDKAGFVDVIFHKHVNQEYVKRDGQCEVCKD